MELELENKYLATVTDAKTGGFKYFSMNGNLHSFKEPYHKIVINYKEVNGETM